MHVLHGTYVHNHLDDIAYASLPISVHENNPLGRPSLYGLYHLKI
jgi:hypothetical protein